MEITIATYKHIPQILDLYEQLDGLMAQFQPAYIQKARRDKALIQSFLETDGTDILIAQENEHVYGFLAICVCTTPEFPFLIPHTYACIMDLVCEENVRGNGIGAALLQAGEAWAKAHQCTSIELHVLAENQHAYDLYERFAYQPCSIKMRRPIVA